MSKLYQENTSRVRENFKPKKPAYHPLKYWLFKRYRWFYRRLLRLRGNPHAIAKGFAVGVFAGCFPFLGFQTFLGILLAVLLKGSKVAATIGTWISNPITYVPLFILNFKVGKLLLGIETISIQDIDFDSLSSLKESGAVFIITFILGCFIVGSILSIVSYFISFKIFQHLKNKRKNKRHQYQ